MSQSPRHIGSGAPFARARDYYENHWSPIPLPKGEKHPPPVGFTGRAGKFPDKDDLTRWLSDGNFASSNIGLRLGDSIELEGKLYEVIGIDVDAYKGTGAQELSQLSAKLGVLPDTWISTSRSDCCSGIRFYLVPYGFAFKGKASESIDIVQRVHRYAVVFPSWHPSGGQYFWYPPGNEPNGIDFSSQIPNAATDLPLLPESWLEYLTSGLTKDDGEGYGADLDISVRSLRAWATEHFNGNIVDEDGVDIGDGMCSYMRNRVAYHIEAIEKSDSNHDKLTNAHWNLICVAAEGHSGLKSAIAILEKYWTEDVGQKKKRRLDELKGEIRRSYEGALRKAKAKADSFNQLGIQYFSGEICVEGEDWGFAEDFGSVAVGGDSAKVDVKFEGRQDVSTPTESGSKTKPKGPQDNSPKVPGSETKFPHWLTQVPFDAQPAPEEYEKNDNSQAQHFYDLYGTSVRYLHEMNAWAIYDGKGWRIDQYNNISQLFRLGCMGRTKKRMIIFATKALEAKKRQDDNARKAFEAKAKHLRGIYDAYSNIGKSEAALKRTSEMFGVSMEFTDLNHNPYILAMPDGNVIELSKRSLRSEINCESKGFRIVPNRKENYTTMTTSVSYVNSRVMKSDPKYVAQVEEWTRTLDLFIPPRFYVDEDGVQRVDRSYQKFVRKVFGAAMIGGNPEKLITFLTGKPHTGKSTFLNCFGVLGDYAGTFTPANVLEETGGPNPELADHFFRRVITASEAGRARIDANMLKRVTGSDQITMRKLYSNKQITGFAAFTIFLATNSAPTIVGEDGATRNRVLALPFDTVVTPDKDDKTGTKRIASECKEAIFSWLLYGYRDYVREGLSQNNWHPTALVKTRHFVTELSDVGSFLAEVCKIAPKDVMDLYDRVSFSDEEQEVRIEWRQVSTRYLYDVYKRWVGEGGKTLTFRNFNNSLKGQGLSSQVAKIGKNSVQVWLGLKVKADVVQDIWGLN